MIPQKVYGASGTSWGKEMDTFSPSSVGTFNEGCLAGFVEIENRNNYSLVISEWGK